MTRQILATKLYIPQPRPDLVSRSRLIERLNAGLHGKLILVSAPAGFGKTSLLSHWVADLEQHVAWLSLDEGDNDPNRFLTYLIAALQSVESGVGKGIQEILKSPGEMNLEAMLTNLLNEIAAFPYEVILVLDDYHVIESQPIDSAINLFLEHLPSHIHLVLVSRIDPSISLSLLRARDEMIEIRADDLRFTDNETTAFLREVAGFELSTQEVNALGERTEGWITGLKLAAISMQNSENIQEFIRSFTGSNRYILDYLGDEVLSKQSQKIQKFLFQTSILNRLTGSLCDAITSDSDGEITLEQLERSNLFVVPLDNDRCWYRYHHLFADLLRSRLKRGYPDRISDLHLKASDWFDLKGLKAEAVDHALAAEDYERAADLINSQANSMWVRGELGTLTGWLNLLPEQQVFRRPELCIFRAWLLYGRGQHDDVEKFIVAAKQRLEEGGEAQEEFGYVPEADQPRLLGRVAVLHALVALHKVDVLGIIQFCHQALELLPVEDAIWRSTASLILSDAYRYGGEYGKACQVIEAEAQSSKSTGSSYLTMISNLKLAVFRREQGKLQEVIEICEDQLDLANRSGLSQLPMTGWLYAIWGEALLERNNLGKAIEYSEKSIILTESGGSVAMLGWSYQCLARIQLAKRDMAGAEKAILRMEQITRETGVPPWITSEMAAWKVRMFLAQDKLNAARQWVKERKLDTNDTLQFLRESEYVSLARILLVQNRVEEAEKLLSQLLQMAEMDGRTSRIIEILLLQTLAHQKQDHISEALKTLEKALSLAEPSDFVRVFVDEGDSIARLLSIMLDANRKVQPAVGDSDVYVNKLLSAYQAEESMFSPATQPLVEPLSPRELEVLKLVAEGLSNQEISERLFLALDTVKGHNSRIYSKLGVKSRTQAVNKAVSLRIISPP